MVAYSIAKNQNVTQVSYQLCPGREDASKILYMLKWVSAKISENVQIPTQTKPRQQTHYISEEVRTRNNQFLSHLQYSATQIRQEGQEGQATKPSWTHIASSMISLVFANLCKQAFQIQLGVCSRLEDGSRSLHSMMALYTCQHILPPRMCREAKGQKTFAYYLTVEGLGRDEVTDGAL